MLKLVAGKYLSMLLDEFPGAGDVALCGADVPDREAEHKLAVEFRV